MTVNLAPSAQVRTPDVALESHQRSITPLPRLYCKSVRACVDVPSNPESRRRIRVVLSAAPLLSFMSVWKPDALAIAELGITASFLVGVVGPVLGAATPWWILATCTIAAAVRAIDMESWALLLPGDLTGRVERAYGKHIGALAAAAALTERFLLAALTLT